MHGLGVMAVFLLWCSNINFFFLIFILTDFCISFSRPDHIGWMMRTLLHFCCFVFSHENEMLLSGLLIKDLSNMVYWGFLHLFWKWWNWIYESIYKQLFLLETKHFEKNVLWKFDSVLSVHCFQKNNIHKWLVSNRLECFQGGILH